MAKRIVKTSKFDYIDNTLINLYSKENPMLVAGDKTYFLFSNVSDIHRKLIGVGTIRFDKFLDSMNKMYYIELEQILESDKIIDKFLFNKKIVLLNAYNGVDLTTSQKVYFLNKTKLPETDTKFFKENLFQVEGFFVRKSFEEIVLLQIEFMQVIKEDLIGQIDDINDLLLEHGLYTTNKD